MRSLLLLFIVMPIVEMWLLIEVGARIGALPTIALVLLTAMVGLAMLRQQGFSTLMRVNQKLERGALPATEMLEGIVLAVGGALLLTPGFVTDAIGFTCLLPFTRRWLITHWLKQFQVVEFQQFGSQFEQQGGYEGSARVSGQTLEGEFREDKTSSSSQRLP